MNIMITGKELKATEAIKEYIEKKCERLQKYTEDEIDVRATIKSEGNNQVAEMSANIGGNFYRAVTEKNDLYASIDKDIDIKIGDEVILFGEGNATVESIAIDLDTINYEVLCMVSRRVERVYMERNAILHSTNYLVK